MTRPFSLLCVPLVAFGRPSHFTSQIPPLNDRNEVINHSEMRLRGLAGILIFIGDIKIALIP